MIRAQTTCGVEIDVPAAKSTVYDFYRREMERLGWEYDTGTHADHESGALGQPQLWGLVNFTDNTDERVTSATILVLSDVATGGGPTRVNVAFQSALRSWNPAAGVVSPGSRPPSYSEVVATYPAGSERCTTVLQIRNVDAQGTWETSGIVDYRNHEPQLQCFGVRLTLEVPVTLGGVTYPAGSLMTVDANLDWTRVSSWE